MPLNVIWTGSAMVQPKSGGTVGAQDHTCHWGATMGPTWLLVIPVLEFRARACAPVLPVSLSRIRYLSPRFRTIKGIMYPYSGRMGRPELTSVKHKQTTAHQSLDQLAALMAKRLRQDSNACAKP